MKLKNIIIILVLFTPLAFYGQQDCGWNTINEISQKYDEGNFDNALDIANKCLSANIDEKQRIEILRLMAKIYLAEDLDSAAFETAKQIIDINRRFEPNYLNDPPSFIQIIQKIKSLNSENTVVSISKKEENINLAPATAVMFTDEQIRRRGYNDFEALLHDLPGFDISRSNGNLYSHIYQRGYRSINTNRTLFLIDGVEDNDLWSSNVYLSRQFIMSNLKSIEIVYGPASTMYGSNAFLGVINIISKDPQDMIQDGKQIGTNMRVGYGSYNTKFLDVTVALQTKDHNIGFSLSGRSFLSDEQNLSSYTDHDYAHLELTNELSAEYHNSLDITDSSEVADFVSQYGNNGDFFYLDTANHIIVSDLGVQTAFNYDNAVLDNVVFSDKTETFAINAKLKIYDFTLGWYFWKKNEGPGSQYTDEKYLGSDQGMGWSPIHHFLYLKYDKDINSKLNFTNFLRFKTHYLDKNNRIVTYKMRYLTGSYGLGNLIDGEQNKWDSIYLFYKANQLRNETKINLDLSSNISVLAGSEMRFSSIQGDYYLSFDGNAEQNGFALTDIPGGNQFFSRDIGLYLQSDFKIIKNLRLTAGGRYDYNVVRQDEGYHSVFNERAAIVYSPQKFIFKAIYATAFKDATNREKYSTAPGKRELSNPDLQPERVVNYEVSLGRSFLNSGIVEAVFYFSDYSNIIQEVKVTREDGTQTGQNQAVGRAQIYGVNAFASWNFLNFDFYANYTYTQPYTIDPKDADGNILTDSLGNEIHMLRIGDMATNRFNFGLNYDFKNILNFNLRTNYVGQRITGENTTVSTDTANFPPYFLLNGTIDFSPPKTNFTIQLAVFNLLNAEYYEPGLDDATGVLATKLVQNRRNLYLSLFYDF